VGALYFYGFFFRHLFRGRLPGVSGDPLATSAPETLGFIELAGAVLLLGTLSALWILPSRRTTLDFSEAEIQFLFPAPVSRRALLHYKLLGGQLGLLFTSLAMSFFSGRLTRLDGAWMAVLGWWLGLLFVQLHGLGASFLRARLFDLGLPHGPRRIGLAGLALVTIPTALVAFGRGLPPFPTEPEFDSIRAWSESVAQAPPLAWVLVPLRWVARLATTRDPAAFAAAAVPVLALVALQYVWVLRANVAFEEAAVDAARRAADRAEAQGKGETPRHRRRPRRGGRRRGPFPLAPVGPSWVALGWKNLIAAGAGFRGTGWVLGLAIAVPTVIFVAGAGQGRMWPAVVASMAFVLLAIAVLFGPGAMRFDFRLDLLSAGDALKALPLPGWQVVLGELLAPWGMLTLFQWAFVGLAFGLLPEESRMVGSEWWHRAVLGVAAALLAPALTSVGLCLQNAAALLFPAWVLVPRDRPRGGFEGMGQQIVVFVGQTLVFLGVLVPAALAGGATFALLAWGLGPWAALLPAAAVAAGLLLAEAALGVLLLGRCWDRLDLSKESIS
jgi:ABC-2 type transport system permease protein